MGNINADDVRQMQNTAMTRSSVVDAILKLIWYVQHGCDNIYVEDPTCPVMRVSVDAILMLMAGVRQTRNKAMVISVGIGNMLDGQY